MHPHKTFTKGRSIFSRSTEKWTCLSIIVSRLQEKCLPSSCSHGHAALWCVEGHGQGHIWPCSHAWTGMGRGVAAHMLQRDRHEEAQGHAACGAIYGRAHMLSIGRVSSSIGSRSCRGRQCAVRPQLPPSPRWGCAAAAIAHKTVACSCTLRTDPDAQLPPSPRLAGAQAIHEQGAVLSCWVRRVPKRSHLAAAAHAEEGRWEADLERGAEGKALRDTGQKVRRRVPRNSKSGRKRMQKQLPR